MDQLKKLDGMIRAASPRMRLDLLLIDFVYRTATDRTIVELEDTNLPKLQLCAVELIKAYKTLSSPFANV